MCLKRSLLEIANDLVSVGVSVATAGYVYPEILAVGGFEDELVEVAMGLNPVEPLVSGF